MRLTNIQVQSASVNHLDDLEAFLESFVLEFLADGKCYLRLPVWFMSCVNWGTAAAFNTLAAPRPLRRPDEYVLRVSVPQSIETRLIRADPPEDDEIARRLRQRWPFYVDHTLLIDVVFQFAGGTAAAHHYTFVPKIEYTGMGARGTIAAAEQSPAPEPWH